MDKNLKNQCTHSLSRGLKKFLVPLSIFALLGTGSILTGCSKSDDTAQKPMPKVAITQIVDHPALNLAYKGILDELHDAGYQEGENFQLIHENAHGNINVAHQIAGKLINQKPAVMVGISTPSAQSLKAHNEAGIPIVFTSVTDPLAANLVEDIQHPGGSVTGAMEQTPWAEILALLPDVKKDIKNIGIIYNAGEANSVRDVKILKKLSPYNLVEATVQNSGEIKPAIEKLSKKVDLILMSSDNTVWSALGTIGQVAMHHKVPTVTTVPSATKDGIMLAYGIAQYDLGREAGKKVIQILEGQPVADIPVTSPKKLTLAIRTDISKKIGLELSEELLARADRLIDEQQGDTK